MQRCHVTDSFFQKLRWCATNRRSSRNWFDAWKAWQTGGRPLTGLTLSLITFQPFASDQIFRKSCLVQHKQQKLLWVQMFYCPHISFFKNACNLSHAGGNMFVFCTHFVDAWLQPQDSCSHENVSCDRVIVAKHIEEAACYICRGMFTELNVVILSVICLLLQLV